MAGRAADIPADLPWRPRRWRDHHRGAVSILSFRTMTVMAAIPKPLVLIAGPPAAGGFLNQLAAALPHDECEVSVLLGDPLLQFPRWPEVNILVAYATTCGAAEIDSAKHLRAIVVPSLGYDGIDVDASTARGIVVANGRVTENFETVAEAAIMLMLMALYDVRAAERRLRDGVIRQGPPKARMLRGKTLGIIGFGNIAREVARRLKDWQVKLAVHTRSAIGELPYEVQQTDLDTLLTTSDIVMPLIPLTAATAHLLNRERLLSMKQGAIIVNVSRGGIIDEQALGSPDVAARLHAIALDVFEVEPLPADSLLRSLPNTILTGHEVAHTAENLTALFQKSVENIASILAGRTPDTVLNPGFSAGLKN